MNKPRMSSSGFFQTAGSAAGGIAQGTWMFSYRILLFALNFVTLVTAILAVMLAYDVNRSNDFYTATKVFSISSIVLISLGIISSLMMVGQGKL